jgi:hypothetical protein
VGRSKLHVIARNIALSGASRQASADEAGVTKQSPNDKEIASGKNASRNDIIIKTESTIGWHEMAAGSS